MRNRRLFFSLAVSVLLAFAPVPARSATVAEVLKKIQNLAPAQRRSALEEGAKAEGQVVIYTSVSLSDYPKILSAFEQSHPGIKTNAYRSTPSGVVRRADTEAKAGRYAVDVIGTAPVETWELRQLQLLSPYLSPERTALFKGAFDPEGFWTAFDVTPIVLAFNTKQVSAQDAPKNYQELLQPKWKGRMSLGTEDYEWFGQMLEYMGRDKGLDYMKALAKQNLNMPGSSSVMRVQLLLGGESAVAVAARGRRVAELKSKGAPIDFRMFDPYAAEPDMLSLMQRSSHPHAAILFYDWLLSQDGQSKMSDLTGRIATRSGVKHLPWLQELLKKDFIFITPATKSLSTKEITDLYHSVFGLYGAK
ncbi:MAG TPA: extracellular solute-binding protein [Candidatus Binatus sp.]|nr:extracellular solute-binding protein [Candidatus Binatus sp.]